MYHFIGIKGSGMSALAQIMKTLGYEVEGSDVDKSFFTENGLKEKNIPFYVYNESYIKEGMLVVVGNSIKEDNVELIKAKELNLKIYTYQEMIGNLIKDYKSIAVAGCHGKTTTTGILAHVLNKTVGANYLIGDGTGHANINNKLFVLEACEYQRHFLSYHPYYIIITNIDLDHVDYFKDLEDVKSAYKDFASQGKQLIVWGDDENIRSLKLQNVLYYGINDNNDIQAKNIITSSLGTKFDVYIKDKFYKTFDLPFYGNHLLLNTLAVITICYLENINKDDILKALTTYQGVQRRFNEEIVDQSIIIDDYAHHPTEIKATILAAKQKYPNKKIITIFQPHTFSRTRKFASEFIHELTKADKAYILDVHPAREKQEDYQDITSKMLIDKIPNAESLNDNSINKLTIYKDEVFLFLGANDLRPLEEKLKQNLKSR
ncbi:MAG: UDP-N-acetylmuramate--L-alanine ligase [Bacilli bacterium]|nr:UDP-N-acetylmuramate--L-alanine ligase [Bacilli bacterium]